MAVYVKFEKDELEYIRGDLNSLQNSINKSETTASSFLRTRKNKNSHVRQLTSFLKQINNELENLKSLLPQPEELISEQEKEKPALKIKSKKPKKTRTKKSKSYSEELEELSKKIKSI